MHERIPDLTFEELIELSEEELTQIWQDILDDLREKDDLTYDEKNLFTLALFWTGELL